MTTVRTKLPVVDADILEKYFQLFLETSKVQMDCAATTLKCIVTREITSMYNEHLCVNRKPCHSFQEAFFKL